MLGLEAEAALETAEDRNIKEFRWRARICRRLTYVYFSTICLLVLTIAFADFLSASIREIIRVAVEVNTLFAWLLIVVFVTAICRCPNCDKAVRSLTAKHCPKCRVRLR